MTERHTIIAHLPWLLVLGVVAAGITNVITTGLAPETAMIADTISDAAAGPYSWVQDFGFYLLVAGFIAQATAMWWELDGWKTWVACCVAFTIMAVSLVLIAAIHEYGDGDEQGALVHYKAVYAYGGAFIALLLLSIPRLKSADWRWLPLNVVTAVLFASGATYFFTMGTQWDGLVERAVAAVQGVWLILFAVRTAWQMGSRPFDSSRLPDLATAADATA